MNSVMKFIRSGKLRQLHLPCRPDGYEARLLSPKLNLYGMLEPASAVMQHRPFLLPLPFVLPFMVVISQSFFKKGGDIVDDPPELLVTVSLGRLEATSYVSPYEWHGDGVGP